MTPEEKAAAALKRKQIRDNVSAAAKGGCCFVPDAVMFAVRNASGGGCVQIRGSIEPVLPRKLYRKGTIFDTVQQYFFLFPLPIIVSVVCPTGPNPPLRLARRPNRGHIGGGGVGPPPAVHAYDVFVATVLRVSLCASQTRSDTCTG